jgi:hypothetical protein
VFEIEFAITITPALAPPSGVSNRLLLLVHAEDPVVQLLGKSLMW